MTIPLSNFILYSVLVLLVGLIAGWLATSRTTLYSLTKLRDVSAERTKVVQGYAQREERSGQAIMRLQADVRRIGDQRDELRKELAVVLRQATAVDDAHEDALDMLRAVPVAFRADETQLLRVVSEPIPEDATVAYGLTEPPRWPDSHSGLYSQVPVGPYDQGSHEPSEGALTAVMDVLSDLPVQPMTATRLDLRVPIGQRRDYPAKPLPGKKTRRKLRSRTAGAR